MTAAQPTAPRLAIADRWVDRSVAVAAVGYSLAWLAGLGLSSTSTTVTSTGSAVLAGITGRSGLVAAQYVVTEVVTAVALLVTLRAVARSAGTPRMSVVAAAVAGLSLAQGALGLTLALYAVPAGDAGLAGGLLDAVNRTDGVKMLLLAVLAGLGVQAGRRGLLPRWLAAVAALLAVAVAVSGLGYLLLVDSLARAAYVSLPLLMLWVTGSGVVVSRRPAQAA